jgi:hypothetical protein
MCRRLRVPPHRSSACLSTDGDWRLADVRTLALSRQFHGVIAWDSFFHLCHDGVNAMLARRSLENARTPAGAHPGGRGYPGRAAHG